MKPLTDQMDKLI